MNIPKVVAVGDRLEIRICVDTADLLSEELPAFETPSMRLRKVEVQLWYRQAFRDGGSLYLDHEDGWSALAWQTEVSCYRALETSSDENGSRCAFGAEQVLFVGIPDRIIPTFQTYIMHRRYEVAVSAFLDCADSLQEWCERGVITIISRPSDGEAKNGAIEENWGPYGLEEGSRLLARG